MRAISWLLFVVAGAAAVLFAVDNRETVSLGFWPIAGTLELPLFLPVMLGAAVGFVCGGAVAWLSGHRWRVRARRNRREAEALERRLRTLEEQAQRSRATSSSAPEAAGTAVAPLPRRAAG